MKRHVLLTRSASRKIQLPFDVIKYNAKLHAAVVVGAGGRVKVVATVVVEDVVTVDDCVVTVDDCVVTDERPSKLEK